MAGFDATIRSAPVPEAKLITVGENPMIALYKITKVNINNFRHYNIFTEQAPGCIV